MKRTPGKDKTDELRKEYDLSSLKGGVRGKYQEKWREKKSKEGEVSCAYVGAKAPTP